MGCFSQYKLMFINVQSLQNFKLLLAALPSPVELDCIKKTHFFLTLKYIILESTAWMYYFYMFIMYIMNK